MKIKLKDSVFAHQKFSTPYNESLLLEWDRTSEIIDDDVVVYTDVNLLDYRIGNANNIAWLIEPREYHGNYYDWLIRNHANFKEIWTHTPEAFTHILDKIKIVPWGGCWISLSDQKIYKKTKLCNIIASGKTQLKGHRLRHFIIENYKGFDLYGYGYNPIEHKITALRDYKFSIVVENTKSSNYFTEKIIDCFRTGTVPIYWGCSNIGNIFNKSGILQFETFEELENILNSISDEKYDSMKPAILDNFEKSNSYLTVEDWLVYNRIV